MSSAKPPRPPASATPGPPRAEGDEGRRGQLIEMTLDSLAEVGYVGSTLSQIAGRAGVSPGLVAHYFGDKDGLLGPERDRDSLAPEQVFFTRDHASGVPATRDGGPGVHGVGLKDKSSLADVVRSVSPTILIGVTAVGGAFSEEVVREMTARVPRPIIFPLSNPTTHAECTAEQAFRWSEGRAIVASGSPFSDVTIDGRVFHCTQTNNMCVRGAGEGAPCRRPHVFLSHPRPHPHPQVRLPRPRPRRQRGARQAHLG